MKFTAGQIVEYLALYAWPFLRISGLMLVAPIFGANLVPRRVKLVLAVMLTILVAPLLPPQPSVPMFSAAGLLVAANQLLIGFTLGFVVQMAFDALVVAGQTVSMTMGLGFATLIDPNRGAQTPVVSQFYVILGLLLFLSLDGHLLLIATLVDSFSWLPVGTAGLSDAGIGQIIGWGARIFEAGVLISLPAVVALLIVNLALGIVSRAAPQLNLFAVGFPVTMLFGFLILLLALPALQGTFRELLDDAFATAGRVLTAR